MSAQNCNGPAILLKFLQMASKKNKPTKKTMLLGLGLDNKDGHTRITAGEDFKLVGGSAETHGVMQEKAIKLTEHLKRRGKTLDTVTRAEFNDIAHKVGMQVVEPKKLPPQSEE
ncbi:MAG: hypothetical protein PCFJNLEI_02985 [Verrucomicrobiae bacterium]|nr:hypothetical protein [Verrucomicrobiae bacterium]